MTLITPRARVLRAVFELSRESEIVDIFSISEEAGLSVYSALATLSDLEKRGMLDARRLKLTLKGVAVAAALGDGAHALEALESGRGESGRGESGRGEADLGYYDCSLLDKNVA
ncbi:MAG: hypothetical protein RJA70_1208 [Pseudomonadota bacterium]|jgi:RIO-like serine/threonine protein kinase